MYTQRILLIEDDPSEAKLAKYHLQKIAPEVSITHFTDGGSFLESCLSDPPQHVTLAIMDLHMHGMGGIETLEQLQEEGKRLPFPILILSSSINPDEVRRAYELGASAFVTKPADAEGYRRVLGHIIDFWLSTNRIA